MDLAFRTGVNLPPVVLYKVGGGYFVHDGNHRVSVARFGGAEMIDAEVTEFFPARLAREVLRVSDRPPCATVDPLFGARL